MHIRRSSALLGFLFSAGLAAGCTIHTGSSSSSPPPRHSHHASSSSHGSSSSSSSSSPGKTTSAGSGYSQNEPGQPAADQPQNPKMPSNTGLTSIKQRMMGVASRGPM